MRAMRTRDRLSIINFAPDRWPTGGEFISSNKTTHGDVDAASIKDFMLAHRRDHPRPFELCFGRRPREENYALAADPHHLQPSPGEDAALRGPTPGGPRHLAAFSLPPNHRLRPPASTPRSRQPNARPPGTAPPTNQSSHWSPRRSTPYRAAPVRKRSTSSPKLRETRWTRQSRPQRTQQQR